MECPPKRRWPTVFVTGTDTGVGKTHVTAGLLRAARQARLDVCGYKPVASGCRRSAHGLRNDDALSLQAAAASAEPYADINPYAFAPAIAPHLAAAAAGVAIERSVLNRTYAGLADRHDWILVEGAGGWQVPLGPDWNYADWVTEQGWPVILVVGMRLGCINHALLSAEAIMRRTRLLGWIANELPPRQAELDANVTALRQRLPAPLLARVKPGRRRLDGALREIFAELCERQRR